MNGRKVWVANAESADLCIIFAATQPGGVSAFLVPADTPGLTRHVTIDSLGVGGLGSMDLELADVRVGADALLGAPGEGFHVAMWAPSAPLRTSDFRGRVARPGGAERRS